MAQIGPGAVLSYTKNPNRHYVPIVGNGAGKTNPVPAILWLVAALIAVTTLRNKALPSSASMGAIAIGTAVVVLVGTVVPRFVEWFLLALLVVVALGAAPQLEAFLSNVGVNFKSLAPSTTGGGTAR